MNKYLFKNKNSQILLKNKKFKIIMILIANKKYKQHKKHK